MTLACLLCAEHTLDCSAFSGTVGTQQSEYRAALHREIQMVYHGFAVMGFALAFNKNRFAHF